MIVIPKGAIPEGTKQEIYFKVCKDNSILPPLDEEKGMKKRMSDSMNCWFNLVQSWIQA